MHVLEAPISQTTFGTLADGRTVQLFTLTNEQGMEVKITDLGGTIVSLRTPDRNGKMADITLGFDALPAYLDNSPYFGTLIGRFGNRIAGGRFSLQGETYTLATNNGPNHLHGGPFGFHTYLWDGEIKDWDGRPSLVLTHFSPDGDEGYPGNLNVQVVYTLTEQNELRIYYAARTDRPTIVNLTNHAYFNLTGKPGTDVRSHELTLHADAFLPVNDALIPTGEFRPVEGGPFDFRQAKPIGQDLVGTDPQLLLAGGYDHNFVLRKNEESKKPQLAATVLEPTSGRILEVLTTEPGVQFYSGNFLQNIPGKGGAVYQKHHGFCLETQHFPDSPNQPAFPSTTLKPGETFRSTTVYRFGVE